MPRVSLYGKKITSVKRSAEYFNKVGTIEKETFEVIKKFADKDKIFLDIGTFYGAMAIYASYLYKKVYSFEADPNALYILNLNIGFNKITNIIIEDKILYDCESKVYFGGFAKFATSGSYVKKEINDNYKYIEKETITLNSVLSKYSIDLKEVNLIKMDIEGSEYEVIKDNIELLSNYKPNLYISIHINLLTIEKINEIVQILFNIYSNVYILENSEYKQVDINYCINNLSNMFLFTENKL